jgi:translation initiation factor IF-1
VRYGVVGGAAAGAASHIPRRAAGTPREGARMSLKEEKIEYEADIVEAFGGGMFKVALENGHEALGYTSGKMRRYRIRMAPGDRVKIELSPYDLTRGRIVYRER